MKLIDGYECEWETTSVSMGEGECQKKEECVSNWNRGTKAYVE
jgi:hypothetical protein